MSVPACAVLVDPQRLPKRGLLQATKDEEHTNKDDTKDDKTVHDNSERCLYTTITGLSRRHKARFRPVFDHCGSGADAELRRVACANVIKTTPISVTPTPIAAMRGMDSPPSAVPKTIATTGLTYEKLVARTGRRRRSTMV